MKKMRDFFGFFTKICIKYALKFSHFVRRLLKSIFSFATMNV